jgi:hypothetical protein
VSAEAVRRTAGRVGRRARRWFLRGLVLVSLALIVLLAVGTAVGRFRFVPTPAQPSGTAYASSDALVVVPVAALRIEPGDAIVAQDRRTRSLLRVEQVVDRDGPTVRIANDPPGATRRLTGRVWRVTASVPGLGSGLGRLGGPIPGVLLMVAGFGLIVRAERVRVVRSRR